MFSQKARYSMWTDVVLVIMLGALLVPQMAFAQSPIGLETLPGWLSSDSDERNGSAAWGDVDGDGDLDLVMGDIQGKPRLYANVNGGLHETAVWLPEHGFASSDAVAWGDVDGDGDLDLVTGSTDMLYAIPELRLNRLYLNDGGSLGTTSAWGCTDTDDTFSVAWADMNGDGYLDLAVGNWGYSKVYLNNGTMLQNTAAWTAAVTATTTSVAWGDVDGDGDLDLAMGNDGMANRLYLNVGGSLQTTAAWTSDEISRTRSIAWGDVDGDGDLDLAVGNGSDQGYERNLVYLNDGGSLNTMADWTSDEVYGTYSVAWGDADGDGDLDLATGNYYFPSSVYLNQGGTLLTTPSWKSDISDDGRGVAWGDVDGDGDLDLAVASYDKPNRLYLNVGGGFNASGTTYASGAFAKGVAFGDVDGDGDLDLAYGDGMGQNGLFLNVDGQLQTSLAWSSDEDEETNGVAWGDMDGDGDLDLAVANNGSPNRVYLNVGENLQQAAAWSSAITETTYRVAWGDVDGDGDLDLAVGNIFDPSKVYFNVTGSLETVPGWSSTGDCEISVAWGDVDGDGDLDLATGNYCGGADSVYLNHNGQLQSTPVWRSDEEDNTFEIAWGDVDGDGDLDLAVANYSGANKVYFNVGGSLQTQPGWVSQESDENYAVVWGDVDGDGDLDLVTGSTYEPVRLYLNAYGSLQTSAAWESSGFNRAGSVALGDVDGDGRLDMASAQAHIDLHLGKRVGSPRYSRPPSLLAIDLRANPVQTFAGTATALAPANFYATPGVRDSGLIPITYTLFDPLSVAMARVEGFYSLDGGGRWYPAVATAGTPVKNLTTSPYPTRTFTNTHVYTWDVLESGVFGQSDNVVFRLVAYPQLLASRNPVMSSYLYTNTQPGPFQQAYVAAQTYPFRVRGNQVRVISSTQGISNALVYRLSQGQLVGAEPYSRDTGEPFRTDELGYLQGRGQINPGDQLFALSPIASDGVSSCITFDSANVPIPISEDEPSSIESALNTAGVGTIVDVNVMVSGTHTWVGDLIFTLESPVGTAVEIIDSACSSDNDFHLTLDDQATSSWTCPPTGGQIVLPSNALSAFNGEDGAGEWILAIEDTYSADGGSLDSWSLEVCSVGGNIKDQVYYTNMSPTLTGVDAYTVTDSGVQTLTISADNPLLLFNLAVSLEWDARKDMAFLDKLDFNLQRVSEFLFDATNGQAALGEVTVYYNKEQWGNADIQIYASNAVIPNADVGGIVITDVVEIIADNPAPPPEQTVPYTITYRPGAVRVGPDTGTDDAWSRVMVHELGHHLFYMYDNYIGFNAAGYVNAVSTCTDTIMTSPYRYDEFRGSANWDRDCGSTLSGRRTTRSDWETITFHYPELTETVNPGPAALPLAVTQIMYVDPTASIDTLEDFVFTLTDEFGAALQPGAHTQVILYQADRLVDLGHPTLNKVLARGAQPGNRLCVYEPEADPPRLGCEILTPEDNSLALGTRPGWHPDIRLEPSSQIALDVEVRNVFTDVTLMGKVYPDNNAPTEAVTFTAVTSTSFRATFTWSVPDTSGYVQIWVDEGVTPRREAITNYALGGSACSDEPCDDDPGRLHTSAQTASKGQNLNNSAISPDGQVLLYANFTATEGFYTLQKATLLPEPLPWTTVVGSGYYILKSLHAPSLDSASINFRYRDADVPTGEKDFMHLYFWTGTTWKKLSTMRHPIYNEVSAPSEGEGLYVLMSSLEIPMSAAGWNLISYPVQETRAVTDALASIDGLYGLIYGYEPGDAADPWKMYAPSLPISMTMANDLHQLHFGQGYWISATQPVTWEVKGETDDAARQVATVIEPPATYYGVVSPTAHFVPSAGMIVRAYVEGQQCGEGQTWAVGNDIVYSVNVGYTPATGACGALGQQVTFEIDTVLMTPTAAWNNNAVWDVPLYVDATSAAGPTLSDIGDLNTTVSTPVTTTFTVSDTDSPLDTLWLYAESSNVALVNGGLNGTLMLGGGISLSGSGMMRMITLTPTVRMTGTTIITVTVSDGVLRAAESFTLTVSEAGTTNTAPMISDIPNQTTKVGESITVTFTISDTESAVDSLLLSASSSNTALVSTTNILFAGNGIERMATITPTQGVTGTTTITITVDDGDLMSSDTFVLGVDVWHLYLPLVLRNAIIP